jgi:hypothetical protein
VKIGCDFDSGNIDVVRQINEFSVTCIVMIVSTGECAWRYKDWS